MYTGWVIYILWVNTSDKKKKKNSDGENFCHDNKDLDDNQWFLYFFANHMETISGWWRGTHILHLVLVKFLYKEG